jgi:hypothetical protein
MGLLTEFRSNLSVMSFVGCIFCSAAYSILIIFQLFHFHNLTINNPTILHHPLLRMLLMLMLTLMLSRTSGFVHSLCHSRIAPIVSCQSVCMLYTHLYSSSVLCSLFTNFFDKPNIFCLPQYCHAFSDKCAHSGTS